ncbi:hypothetical protein ACLB2K_026111 [Fragaria x ananassa]
MVQSPQVPMRESRGDGGDVPKTGWREETFAATLASQFALGWGLSLCDVAPRRDESVRTWLGRLAIERCGPLPWQVSPLMVGDCRDVASQSALGWGDTPLSVTGRCLGELVRTWLGTVAMWQVSPRLVGDCCYVASQSALGWGLLLCGESVRAWLGTVAMWRCGHGVASQSALGWGDSSLSVAGRCLGESIRAWPSLGTFAIVSNVGLIAILWSVSRFGGVLPLE